MSRENPSSQGAARHQPAEPQTRPPDDQRESQASKAGRAAAPGTTSLDTGDPAVQSPLSGRPRRPEGSYPPANWKSLLLIAAIAIVCGAAGAWAMHEFTGPSKKDNANRSSKQGDAEKSSKSGGSQTGGKQTSGGKEKRGKEQGGSGQTSAGASAEVIPGFTSADDAETLKKQIKHLAERLEQVDRRIDTLQKPENETPPVVHTLQVQVTELAKEVDQTANLPAKFRRLERRLSSVEQQFKTLRDELPEDESPAAADESRSADAGSTSPGEGPAASDSDVGDDDSDTSEKDQEGGDNETEADGAEAKNVTLDLGAELFQQGKYAQARDVFRRLQRARPHDARVWYFSALANGLVTHAWDSKTARLFEKGIERERAGDPAAERIDAAFADLKPPEARQWLDYYRRQAKKDAGSHREQTPSESYRLTPESFKVP